MNPKPFNTHDRKYTIFTGLIFILLLSVSNLFGSTASDSLNRLVKRNSKNPERLSVLFAQLSKELRKEHNDSCFQVAQFGLRLAEKSGFNEGIMKNLYQLARYLISIDSLESSKQYLLRANMLTGSSTDPMDKMSILITLGYIYGLQSSYSISLEYYFKGLEIAESINQQEWQQFFINNIATVYNSVEQYQKSINYYRKSLEYFRVHRDSSNYANTLVNIGVAFLNLDKTDSALYYFNQAEPIQMRLNNYYGLTNLYFGRGSLLMWQKKYAEALKMFIISRKMIDSLDQRYYGSKQHLRLSTENKLAKAYKQLKSYSQAENLFRTVLGQSRKEDLVYYESEALLGLSEIFEATGRNDSALKYARKYQLIFDSLKNVKEDWKLGIVELEYRNKKEQEMRLLQEQKQKVQKKTDNLENILFVISILAFVSLLLLIIFIQRSKTRRLALEKTNLRLEKENLQMDIALKNKELTIKSMSLMEKDELLTDVTKQLRGIVETENEEGDAQLRMVIRELQQNDSKRFWDEFNKHFKEVHVDFHSHLSKDFPQITPNELKLCAFLKLNLSTKQIAHITRKSEHSIKIARYRLRQKLGLDREENLSIFLSKY